MNSVVIGLATTATGFVIWGIFEGLRKVGSQAVIASGRWCWEKMSGKKTVQTIPDLVFVTSENDYNNFWHIGTYSSDQGERKPCLQLAYYFTVTNNTQKPMYLISAQIKEHKKSVLTQTLMVKSHENSSYGRYPILPGHTTEGRLVYLSKNITATQDRKTITVTLLIKDHLNKQHVQKNIKLIKAGEVGFE